MKVALYARLSVTTEESVSIDRQLDSGRAYAKARGWEVVLEAVDDGVSATKNKPEDRTGWRQILDAPQHYNAVVVWKVDRLARRVLDFLHADDALRSRGAGLVAVEDPIDMTSAQGRAFATMLAVFGEMEAAAISARVTAARRTLVKMGRRPGGRPPYGFMNIKNPDGEGMVLAQNPDEIGTLIEMASRAARGDSIYSITQWLESEGIRPRPRKGRKDDWKWSSPSVEGILRAPALAGMTPYTPGRLPGDDKADVLRGEDGLPIVDESYAIMTPAEHRAMLAVIDSGKAPGSRPHANYGFNMLLGVAKCSSCGGSLYRASATDRPTGKKYWYLRCAEKGCPKQVNISLQGLVDYVTDRLLSIAGDFPVVRVEATGNDESIRLSEIEASIKETTVRLAETDVHEVEEELTQRLRQLKEARREARAKGAEVTEREVVDGRTFAEVFRDGDDNDKREAIRSAFSAIIVSPSQKRGNVIDHTRVELVWTS